MEIPREGVLVGMRGFFPHNMNWNLVLEMPIGVAALCSESGNGGRQHWCLVLAWDEWVPRS